MKLTERSLGLLILPLFVLLLNLGLKFSHLTTIQIGLDEPATIFYAQMPPGKILEEYTFSNSPPMLELILHAWMKVFGNSVTAVRFPSLLFACCTAVLLYGLGWRVHSRQAGLFAALVYTFSSYMTYFSHEARVYALFAMLTVASLWCLLWLRARPASWLRTVVFAVVNLLLSYCHYFAFFVIAWECLWILAAAHPARRALLWRAGMAMGVMALLWLPKVATLLLRFERTSGDHWVGLSSFAGLYANIAKYVNQPVVAVAVLLVLGWAGLRWLLRRWQGQERFVPEVLLVLGLFPGAYLLLWGMGLFMPVFLDRYLIFTMPGFYLVLALSIAYVLPPRWPQWALGAAFVVLFATTTDLARDSQSAWREVAAKVRSRWTPGDAVVLHPEYPHFSFAYAHYDTRLRAAGIFRVLPRRPLPMDTLASAGHIWVIQAGRAAAGLPASVDSLLQTGFRPGPAVEGNHGITVTGFVRR
jgi:mannosyltransferase